MEESFLGKGRGGAALVVGIEYIQAILRVVEMEEW